MHLSPLGDSLHISCILNLIEKTHLSNYLLDFNLCFYFILSVQRLRSMGIIDKMFWNHNQPKCLLGYPISTETNILSLYQLQGAFWALLFGLSVSSLIFFFEFLIQKLNRKFT